MVPIRLLGHKPRPVLLRWIACLLVILAVSSGFLGSATASELSDAKERAAALVRKIADQKELVGELNGAQDRLRSSIRATKGELSAIAADLAAVRERVQDMKREVRRVQDAYDALVADLADLDTELDRITAAERQKRAEFVERQAVLGDRLRESYDASRTSMLEIFLSAGGFTDILTILSYQLDAAERDRELAEAIRIDRETLLTLERSVAATRDQTNALRQETAAQKQRLDDQLVELREAQATLKEKDREAKRVLAAQRQRFERLAADEAGLRASMARAARERRKLERKIDGIIAAQARGGNVPSSFNGTFRWPMRGSISQDYGCTGFGWEPKIGDCNGFHQGIDLVAPYGTPVRAAAAGRVAYVGWNYADGADPAWIVIIAHSSNLETWYAHMQDRTPRGIRTGARVKAGQVIGYEGNTGRSTGAHLHWAVRRNGTFVNPRLFL